LNGGGTNGRIATAHGHRPAGGHTAAPVWKGVGCGPLNPPLIALWTFKTDQTKQPFIVYFIDVKNVGEKTLKNKKKR